MTCINRDSIPATANRLSQESRAGAGDGTELEAMNAETVKQYAHDIFVFGSNLEGRHGKGAALTAAKYWGAQAGVGQGLTGRAFAIPTKMNPRTVRSMAAIKESVRAFLVFASVNPETRFLLTRIGCGLAAYTEPMIAPLFANATPNVLLISDNGDVRCPASQWAAEVE